MDFFSYLAAFLLIRRLQRALKFSPLYAKWSNVLSVSLGSTIIIYVVTLIYFEDTVRIFAGSLLLAALVVFINRETDFKIIHSFARVHYPLIAVGLIAGLVQLVESDFYDKYDSYFEFAIIGAFVWTLARWATSKKQQEEFKIISQQNF